jgi:hypothetical protein
MEGFLEVMAFKIVPDIHMYENRIKKAMKIIFKKEEGEKKE